jgi:hypothetical protein
MPSVKNKKSSVGKALQSSEPSSRSSGKSSRSLEKTRRSSEKTAQPLEASSRPSLKTQDSIKTQVAQTQNSTKTQDSLKSGQKSTLAPRTKQAEDQNSRSASSFSDSLDSSSQKPLRQSARGSVGKSGAESSGGEPLRESVVNVVAESTESVDLSPLGNHDVNRKKNHQSENLDSKADSVSMTEARNFPLKVEPVVREGNQLNRIELKFPGDHMLKTKFPKAFQLTEEIVNNWACGGSFESLPIENPFIRYAAKSSLKKAKLVETRVLESPVTEKIVTKVFEVGFKAQRTVEEIKERLHNRPF